MKSNSFSINLFGLFLKSILNSHHSGDTSIVLTSFFLISFFIAFPMHGKGNSSPNYTYVLKATTFPLADSESIRANLYLLNDNNTTQLEDGVLTEYNNLFNDSVYLEDAYKFTKINENLGLSRYGSVMAIERRPVIVNTDTLFYKLWKTVQRNYQFEFVTHNLDHPGMEAYLEDTYLGTRTLIVLYGTTKINFSIDISEASSNIDRFRIIYQTHCTLENLPLSVKY